MVNNTTIIKVSVIVRAFLALSMFLLPAVSAQANAADIYQIADARDVVRDESTGTVAHSTSGECVRTHWMNGDDVCSPTTEIKPRAVAPSPVRSAASLSREERVVYFGFNDTRLSPQMMAKLGTLSSVLRSDNQVKGARIIGYADHIGSPSYNEKLSEKRVGNVMKYLASKNLVNAHVADIRWLGDSVPATSCPANLKRSALIDCLQEDRRVEIEIDYVQDMPDLRASR